MAIFASGGANRYLGLLLAVGLPYAREHAAGDGGQHEIKCRPSEGRPVS